MFEQSLVESTSLLRTTNRWPAVIAFAVQATALVLLLALPLLHPGLLPLATPHLSQLSIPLTVPTPPKPPVHLENAANVRETPSLAPSTATQTLHPIHPSVDSTPAPTLSTGLMIGNADTSPFASILTSGPSSPSISHGSSTKPSSAPTSHTGQRVAISTGVSLGLLLAPIRPEYPAIAKIARTEGTVIVQAIISRSGHIESAHVVSGPAILQNAALEAVRNARYRPYLLNDQPTEVETTISIIFRMDT